MKTRYPTTGSFKPIIIGLIVFALVFTLSQYLSYQRYLIKKVAERDEVLREINTVKDRIKTSLSYSLSATKTLSFIVETYGVPGNFESVAKEILETGKDVDALELTQKGIITHVYPLKDNEGIIGYDVLGDSTRNREAYKAIEKKEIFFAGPFKLKQGGTGIVGRLPIFKDNKFIGFSAVVIKLSTLLKAAGIDSGRNSGFIYQLSKINPTTHKEEFFLPDKITIDRNQSVSIEVPDGEWTLYAQPRHDISIFNVIAISLLGLILSIICGLFAWQMALQPAKLNNQVEEKTIELATREKYYRSLIEKSADAIVLFDSEGNVVYQTPSTENISGYSLREIQRLDGLTLIHPDDREEDKATFTQLVQSPGASIKRNHRFKHKDGYYIWIEGTYTNLLNDENVRAVVYNYYDATERIKAEEQVVAEKVLSDSIINSLPGVFYLYDRNGKFLKWNRNFELVSGYSSSEISNMHPLDFFHGDDYHLLKEKIDNVFENGRDDVSSRFYTKGKEMIPYYFNGHKVNFNGTDYLIGMGIDITDRIAAENELRKYTREIQKLTAHLKSAQEEERTRIAREIHDELGQQLTGLKMEVNWIEKRMPVPTDPIQNKETPLVQEKLSGIKSLIDETIEKVRRIASELRPGILDDLGLTAALEWSSGEFEKRTGIKSHFYSNMNDFNPEREMSINIFRVHQEALTNVLRHAEATEVSTSLEEEDGHIILRIKDNGCGFDKDAAKSKNSLGLIGMKERALLFDGEMYIESGKSKGTVITLKIPILQKENRPL